jgi:hypothetical protein
MGRTDKTGRVESQPRKIEAFEPHTVAYNIVRRGPGYSIQTLTLSGDHVEKVSLGEPDMLAIVQAKLLSQLRKGLER